MEAASAQAWLMANSRDGKRADAGVFSVPDPVFYPRVSTMPGFEEGQLPGGGVGGDGLVAPAFGVFEQGEGRAGVGVLAAE